LIAKKEIDPKDDLVLEGITIEDINEVIKTYKLKCPACDGEFKEANSFNLMFPLQVGADKESDNVAYLRGETAQVIFTHVKLLAEISRLKLPFGIAQIGKAFRNEISPRDFLFRVREFEQMEIEFFTHPKKKDDCPYYNDIKSQKINYYDNKKQTAATIDKLKANKWLKYWLALEYQWFLELGINAENIRVRQHTDQELAHYAQACFDIEYKFPFGWKEIYGNADRGTFDLMQHEKTSKKDLKLFDEETKEKTLPAVASEPSQGVGRAFLALMFDAYNDDKKRGNIVLKLNSRIAPVKVGIFPLVSNKENLLKVAYGVFDDLKEELHCQFDKSGSVGRRYARADEIGIPFCITVDFDSLEDKSVTIRDRDSTKQKRIKISDLRETLKNLIEGKTTFSKI